MKKFYSQHGEDKVVYQYLNQIGKGNVLDLGANDGMTISNSLSLIEDGWGATLIEASPFAFKRMEELHKGNDKVQCLNFCLATENKKYKFYHNITHYGTNDIDLLSTICENKYDSAKGIWGFSTFEVDGFKFSSIEDRFLYKNYEIISIDIEGMDYEVLSEIDLTKYNCQILIIEYNNDVPVKNKIMNYCSNHGMNQVIFDNGTNIILKK